MNQLEALNQTLFLTINATMATPAWQVHLGVLIAKYVIYLIPLLLISMWLWGDEQRRSLAIRACLVILLALGINQIIGQVWPHPRPFMIGLGYTFLAHAPDPSFPSDHTTIFAGMTLTLLSGAMYRTGLFMLPAGLSVAWARVFIGVHFPLDIIGAAGVACLAYLLLCPVWALAGNAVTRTAIDLYRTVLKYPIDLGWVRR